MADTTRRAALGAILAAPAVAALGASSAMASLPVSRADWGRAEAALARARATMEALSAADDAASARYEALAPKLDMIDFRELNMSRQFPGEAIKLDVKAHWRAFLKAEGKTWWAVDPAATKAKRKAALRNIVEYRRLDAEAERISGAHAATERYEDSLNAFNEAEQALLDTPAPDFPALLWKLENLLAIEGDGWTDGKSAEAIAQTMADARRLLSTGHA